MDIQAFIGGFLSFLNTAIIPLLVAIAFVVFLWNITRYFIIGGTNEEDREKARSVAMWGIATFVIILSIWGIVNLLISDLGFGGDVSPITPDYIKSRQAPNCWDDPFGEGCNPIGDPCSQNPNADGCDFDFGGAA